MRIVVVVAFDGVQLLDVTGPVEALTTTGCYDVRVVSPTGADVRTSSGVRIGVDHSVGSLPGRFDTLLVPGRPEWRTAVSDTGLVSLVSSLAERARRVASVCAGAFLLAEAGLLDGRRATTHWQLARDLARTYPRVLVEPDPLFVRSGPVVTSAGITAGIDLALSLIEEDHGPDVARSAARYLVVFMARPGGQSQFSARMGPAYSSHSTVRKAMDHVTADPAGDHSLDVLADVAGVSPRHLTRLFRAELDITPAQFVETIRFEAARVLLQNGTSPIEAVAGQAGFGSSESMRRAFQDTLGISPSTYRARFRSTSTVSPPFSKAARTSG
ncbi:GlxA family transcriptional regulator [Actinocrispum sp. NPDC049592]|uniref:GlxA family transcriptional regulator n=1 Tax=Actinocrispum sp. NPDC049592 TaxID=3154835 RepID=UPI00342CF45E